MTTKTQKTSTENTDTLSVFLPLRKYVVIAVIMVSVIVTSSIMLDDQFNTFERNLSVIESEVAAMNNTYVAMATDIDADETISVVDSVTNTTHVTEINNSKAPGTTVDSLDESASTQKEKHSTKHEVTATNTKHEVTATVEATPASDIKAVETATHELQVARTQATVVNNENSLRGSRTTYKSRKKQRMSNMFNHMKAREAKQLDKYKANQDKQIARRHNQIIKQQKMVEVLVVRNKDLFEYRVANFQRIQENREEILNRI